MKVRDIRVLIDDVIIPGYKYRINFSSADFLVEINDKFVIFAKAICENDKFYYELALDTQFLYSHEISYSELIMLINIMNILEENKKFVFKRLKKYTVLEYKNEQKKKEGNSQKIFEALQNMITKVVK